MFYPGYLNVIVSGVIKAAVRAVYAAADCLLVYVERVEGCNPAPSLSSHCRSEQVVSCISSLLLLLDLHVHAVDGSSPVHSFLLFSL